MHLFFLRFACKRLLSPSLSEEKQTDMREQKKKQPTAYLYSVHVYVSRFTPAAYVRKTTTGQTHTETRKDRDNSAAAIRMIGVFFFLSPSPFLSEAAVAVKGKENTSISTVVHEIFTAQHLQPSRAEGESSGITFNFPSSNATQSRPK